MAHSFNGFFFSTQQTPHLNALSLLLNARKSDLSSLLLLLLLLVLLFSLLLVIASHPQAPPLCQREKNAFEARLKETYMAAASTSSNTA